MKIPKIELTNKDMYEAVGDFLKKKGLNLTVQGVDTKGYPINTFIIDCEEKSKAQPPEPEPLPKVMKNIIQESLETGKEFVAP